MPVYDYRCTTCDVRFEVSRPMGAAVTDVCCTSCGAEAKRVFTPVGVAFKGSGFHNTDYKTRSKTESAAPPSKESACPSAKEGSSGCAGCPAAS